MVRLFKKREPIEEIIPDISWPKEIIIRHSGLSVTHVIEKKPDPRPVRGFLVWTNQNGQRWQSQPFTISGEGSFPIQVPLAWLTGRDKDIAKLPVDVTLMLEY